jgi:aminocarboxymuconate-semialdehyde decarboxylase
MHARMDRQAQADVAVHKPSDYAARFAYDSVLHAGKPLIMLGTDYSFPPADLTPMQTLRQAGFTLREIEQIAKENPRRAFHLD